MNKRLLTALCRGKVTKNEGRGFWPPPPFAYFILPKDYFEGKIRGIYKKESPPYLNSGGNSFWQRVFPPKSQQVPATGQKIREFSCQGQNSVFPGHITCLRYAAKIAEGKFFAPSFSYRYFHEVPVKLRKNQNLNISHQRPKKSPSNRKKPDKRRKHNKSGICLKNSNSLFRKYREKTIAISSAIG